MVQQCFSFSSHPLQAAFVPSSVKLFLPRHLCLRPAGFAGEAEEALKEQGRVDAGNKQGKEDSWDSCEVAALPGLSRLAAWFESIQCLRKVKAMRR